MGTSSTFSHEMLERIQEKIITVLPKIKTGQVVKYAGYPLRVIRLDQKTLSVPDPTKNFELPFNRQGLHHAV